MFKHALIAAAAVLSLSAGFAPAQAQSARACPHPESDRDKIALTLKSAATCRMAHDLMNACRSNTSGDVELAEIVIERCEADFLPGLTATAKASYQQEREQCGRRYPRRGGTINVSFSATCEAGVAARYATTALRRSRPK